MCYQSKSHVIYYNSKKSSCFTTFHPYCLRFSCYTLDKKIRGPWTALKRKNRIIAASTLKQVMTHPVGAAIIGPILQRMAAAAGGATRKKEYDASSMSMMMGIQLNTLVDFHVLTEEQLNGILSQINQA